MEPAELISNGKNTQIKAVVQPDAVSHLSIVFFKTRRSGGTGAFMPVSYTHLLDPVALDQACVDAVYASPDPGKAALIERMESRNGIHTVETACALGIGVREYELIYLD